MKTSTSRSVFWLTVVVFLLAAAVRLWGIQHDLPYSFYPDESHFIKRALSFGSGDFNPHWFHKPAFFMYVLFFEYGLLYSVGRIIGCWPSVEEFAVSFILNPGPFVLIGRLTTVAFSLGTVLGVWRIGEKYLGKHVGLIAALFLAITYGHVTASRHVKADVPAAFFCIWSAYFLLGYARDSRLRNLIFASLLAGVGAATKFYPVVMLAPICLIVLMKAERDETVFRWLSRTAGRVLTTLVLFAVSFFAVSPYSVLDPLGRRDTFGRVGLFTNNVTHSAEGDDSDSPGEFIQRQSGYLAGAAQFLQVMVSRRGMGLVIGPICIAGLIMTSFDRKNLALCLFPVLLAFTSIITYPGYAEARHQVAIYPFLGITGAALAVAVLNRANWRPSIIAIFSLLLLPPLLAVTSQAAELSKRDTRNLAKRWIEDNIPKDSRLVVSENGPPILTSRKTLASRLEQATEADRDGQFTAHYHTYVKYQLLAADRIPSYDIHEIRYPWWREEFREQGQQVLDTEYDRDMANPLLPVGVNSYNHYVKNGFDYAIVHSDHYIPFTTSANFVDRFPAYREFYEELLKKGELVEEIAPDSRTRGPIVRIYRFSSDKQ